MTQWPLRSSCKIGLLRTETSTSGLGRYNGAPERSVESMTRYNTEQVSGWLQEMQQSLQHLITHSEKSGDNDGDNNPVAMIGIKTGGVDVGKHLHKSLGLQEPLGELNISFYRDDFSTVGLHPVVGPSQVPFSIDGRHIILVDDVLSTGRTVRAAMNEIFDYGRPSRITLAVLIQRTGHELPIRADVIGQAIDLSDNMHVSLDASDMSLTISEPTSETSGDKSS